VGEIANSSVRQLSLPANIDLNAYALQYIISMVWAVEFHQAFVLEFRQLFPEVQDELLVQAGLLQEVGPTLGRPRVDTLNGSKHANMKELRFNAADGVWRVAFAFDPNRKAIMLVAGDKSGTSERRFYRNLIKTADTRFDDHLKQRKQKG
jgi:hypothetical protein